MNEARKFESADAKPPSYSVSELNKMAEKGHLNAELVLGLPEFDFKPQMLNYHDFSYYEFDPASQSIRALKEDFFREVRGLHTPAEIIEKATVFLDARVSWVGKEPTRNVARLVESGQASCTGKALLLGYLLTEAGLKSFYVSGYAKNVDVTDCVDLQKRNRAYKKGSLYPNNLFNLPLDDKPIEEDVEHAWVAVDMGGEVVYADPTTGLVSTTDSERAIFKTSYKTTLGTMTGGLDNLQENSDYASYHDLDFNEPIIRTKVKITAPIPLDVQYLQCAHFETPDGEAYDRLPIVGFENIVKVNN